MAGRRKAPLRDHLSGLHASMSASPCVPSEASGLPWNKAGSLCVPCSAAGPSGRQGWGWGGGQGEQARGKRDLDQ